MAVYLVGLLIVVTAVWVFLTQTPIGRTIPSGIGLALILVLVGIGIMASARSLNDRRAVSRVVHEGYAGPAVVDRRYASYEPGYMPAAPVAPVEETVVEERRFD